MTQSENSKRKFNIILVLILAFMFLKVAMYWFQIFTTFISDNSMLRILFVVIITTLAFLKFRDKKPEDAIRSDNPVYRLFSVLSKIYISTFLILLFYLASVNYSEVKSAMDFPPLSPFIELLFFIFYPFFIFLTRAKNPFETGIIAALALTFVGFDFAFYSSLVFTFFMLLILFFLLERYIGHSGNIIPNPFVLPILFVYISSLLSSFFSSYIYQSLLFFQPYIIIFTFFLLISTEANLKLLRSLVMKVIIVGNIFLITICLTKLIFNITYKGPIKAIFERLWVSEWLPPTYLGENIIIFVMLISGIFLKNSGFKKFSLGLLIIIDLFLLGIMRSKGSILGLFAGSLYLAALYLIKKYNLDLKTLIRHNNFRKIIFPGILILLMLLFVSIYTPWFEDLLSNESLEYRLFIWKASLRHFIQNPILGSGYENQYQRVMFMPSNRFHNNDISDKWFVQTSKHTDFVLASPHSIYFGFAESLGLAGFVLLLWLFFTTLKRNFQCFKASNHNRDWLIVWGIGGSTIAYLTNLLTASPLIRYLFILFIFFALQEDISGRTKIKSRQIITGKNKRTILLCNIILIISVISLFSLPVINKLSAFSKIDRFLPLFCYQIFNADKFEKKGVKLLSNLDYKNSNTAFKHAALSKRKYSPYYHVIGLFEWYLNNNPQKAFSYIQKSIEYDPLEILDNEYYLDAGILAASLGQKEEAIKYLNTALYKDPSIINVYWNRVHIRGKRKTRDYDIMSDIEVYNKEGNFTPKLKELLKTRLTMQVDKFNKIEDIRPVALLLKDEIKDNFYFPLMPVLDKMKTNILALSDHQSSMKAEGLLKLSMCYKTIGKYEKIIDVLKETEYLWDKGKYGLDLVYMLGETYSMLGKWEEACDVYKKGERFFEAAVTYKRMGKLDQAEKYFFNAINKTGTAKALEMRIKSYRELADLYAKKGDFVKAEESYEVLMRLENHPINYFLYADFLTKQGLFNKALDILKQGLDKYPKDEKLQKKLKSFHETRNTDNFKKI